MRRIIAIIALLNLAACSQPDKVQTLSGFAQATTWHVTVWQPGGVATEQLEAAIQAEFARLDQALSNYRSDSVIERFNSQPSAESVAVGDEIVTLVQTARRVSEASHGCYDLTIKPLFDLWGFSGDTLTPPTADALTQTRQHLGYNRLTTPAPGRLRKADPRIRVDLSSIAQGHSVARIAAVVEAAGISDYLVEIGGELQTRGHKPDGSPWRIGVERPLPGGRSVQKALTIGRDEPVAVMTSGTYRHYFDAQGQRYGHVLDARTGQPISHDTVSVTVIHDDPTVADAWSTALLCLGDKEGLDVANQNRIAALFIAQQGDQLREMATASWQSMQAIEVQ